MRMRPEAIATRWVAGFSPTSTMWAEPLASKWVSSRFASSFGRYHKQMRITAFLLATLVALLAPRAWAQSLPDLGSERRRGPVAAARAAHRREHHARHPLPRAELRRRRRRSPTTSRNLGARLTQAPAGARQDFEFFAIRDHTINAFALPGGFIGVHTGLLTASESESEVASVLAHEVAHVTQRHIARMLGQQQQMQLPVLAALAAAILLGRSRPDLASGAAAAASAGAIQTQLSYSRDFEREADRIGFQALEAAGFDVHAMGTFFEKMQRGSRIADDGSVPGYLRTHPITTERIADAQNRAASLPYKQHPDSPEFQLVRAKLRAE